MSFPNAYHHHENKQDTTKLRVFWMYRFQVSCDTQWGEARSGQARSIRFLLLRRVAFWTKDLNWTRPQQIVQ